MSQTSLLSSSSSSGNSVSYTPIAKGSTSDPTVTYNGQVGYYVLVGKLCYVTMYINWDGGNYTGGSGNAGISLPFAAQNTANLRQTINGATGGNPDVGYAMEIQPGASVGYIFNTSGFISTATQGGIGSNSYSGCYIIA